MPKPKLVEEWEESLATVESFCPQCCYTCFDLVGNLTCQQFGTVPLEFMETMDACPKWNRAPF
jgi:hypothetical protein